MTIPGRRFTVALFFAAFVVSAFGCPAQDQLRPEPAEGRSLGGRSAARPLPRIRWQPDTLVLIQPRAAYGRMARLPDGSILCAYSRDQAIHVRLSADEGRTWAGELPAVRCAHGAAANAELLVVGDGRVLVFYNERPSDGRSFYAIGVCTSLDGGRTWGDCRRLYTAGREFENGCWEPAAVELPGGEIQLFFANEAPYRESGEQEITRMRSGDGGATWQKAETFSFRPGYRDGMPVPLCLVGGRGIAVAIEDNGLAGRFKPVILRTSREDGSNGSPIGAGDPRRRAALAQPLPKHVYAGAPYLAQLPSGETILSVQSTEGRHGPHDHTNSRMVVYVGDETADGFANRSEPFGGLTDAPGLWNSLFVKSAETVTAVSGTTVNGLRGLWAIDGHVVRD